MIASVVSEPWVWMMEQGWSNERCCWGGEAGKKWGQAGGTAVGPSLCSASPLSLTVPCFGGQHLQPALHAKHTLRRGRLHMGLRGQKKSIPQAALGEEGGGTLQQPRSLQVELPSTPPPLPHHRSEQGDAVMRTGIMHSLQLFSHNLKPNLTRIEFISIFSFRIWFYVFIQYM